MRTAQEGRRRREPRERLVMLPPISPLARRRRMQLRRRCSGRSVRSAPTGRPRRYSISAQDQASRAGPLSRNGGRSPPRRSSRSEPEMARAGQRLAAEGAESLRRATWVVSEGGTPGRKADLVVLSYVLGELAPAALEASCSTRGEEPPTRSCSIEPGTTAGYHRMLAARAAVIAAGGSVLAPCPHDAPCPLPKATGATSRHGYRAAGHIASRREPSGGSRTRSSRTPSSAASPTRPAEARVIRRPDPRPGHVVLDLCTPSGLEQRTVSKREGRDTGGRGSCGLGEPLPWAGDPAPAVVCVTLRPCSASPSSLERRPGSARRPRARSPQRGWHLRARRAPRGSPSGARRRDRRRGRAPATSATAPPSRRSRPACWSGTPRSRRSSTTRASPPGGRSGRRARPRRGGRTRQLPRRRLDDARAAPGPAAPPGGRRRTSSTSSPSQARSRSRPPGPTRPRSTRSSHSRGRCRRRCAGAASTCTRSCRATSRPRASRSGRSSSPSRAAPRRRAARAGVASDRRAIEGRDREVVVPWFPYRPATLLLRRRSGHSRGSERAASHEAGAFREKRRTTGNPRGRHLSATKGRRRHGRLVRDRRGDGTATRSPGMALASSRVARRCSHASQRRSTARSRSAMLRDSAAVAAPRPAHPRAASAVDLLVIDAGILVRGTSSTRRSRTLRNRRCP